ncbi:MAG TPA: SGNH/GDSL hydrolase family protein [Verrucomicrobiae bacterium]|jgi:lysophospholipase L1-like esterase|nr:SGNH/GDSL hydrolase family protein [Verrucomicrobiae bacterium]
MKATCLIKSVLTLTCFVLGTMSARPAPPAGLENIEWCDIWMAHANETNQPRVLLIGDSITRAYYDKVESRLAGRAFVGRLATSAFISDPVLLQEITMTLDEYPCDVVHFNNGMHGWQHTEAEYQAAFPKFSETIKAHAPHAKLIWANTTSLKVSPPVTPGDHASATDERIDARNRIALGFIEADGLAVDDLNSLTRGRPDYHSDNVHFNDAGTDLQARQVAGQIERALGIR